MTVSLTKSPRPIAISIDAALSLADVAGYSVRPVGEVGWGYAQNGARWIGRRLATDAAEILLCADGQGVVIGAYVRVGSSDAITIDPSNASVTRAILFAQA
jgi:hypothetical protein